VILTFIFIYFISSTRSPALLSYLVSFHMSQARWQNFMRIGLTFWNSFIKSKCQGLATHFLPPATHHPPNHLPPNAISLPGVPANASDFHLTLMMFIYFGENGKYTKYMCICNMCTENKSIWNMMLKNKRFLGFRKFNNVKYLQLLTIFI